MARLPMRWTAACALIATAATLVVEAAAPAPAANDAAASRAPDPAAISTSVLPEDSTRRLVIKTCVVCHPAELLISKRRTPETWDRVINKMVDYGARADDEQQEQILAYFIRYFEGTDTSIGAPVAKPPGP